MIVRFELTHEASRKHLAILHQPEIQDLFGPPRLTIEEKRFYFTPKVIWGAVKPFTNTADEIPCFRRFILKIPERMTIRQSLEVCERRFPTKGATQ